MERAGAVLTTAETAAFELLRDAGHPAFKRVQGLFRWDLMEATLPPDELAIVEARKMKQTKPKHSNDTGMKWSLHNVKF